MKTQKTYQIMLISLLLVFAGVFLVFPHFIGETANAQVTYQTPTPDAEGRILYTVQEGDTCTRIFLLTGVTIEQIITLNNLNEACDIFPGDKIVLGIVTPPTQMPTDATIAPAQLTPSPTPAIGFAELCVVLFDDVDGNGMRAEEEFYLQGGAVSLNNRLGTVSKTGTTVGGDPELVEPLCFEDVPEGDYNITIGIPDGYNTTTLTNYTLTLKAGNQAMLDFGAQVSTNVVEPEAEQSNNRSPLLGIVGGLILVGGIILGIYMWRSKKVSS